LKDHHIITDTALQITPDIVHYQWNFDKLAKHISPQQIKDALSFMEDNIHFEKLTLADLLQNIHDQNESLSPWTIAAIVMSTLAVFGFIIYSLFGIYLTPTIRMFLNAARDKLVRIAHRNLQQQQQQQNVALDVKNQH
jgi:hypothetical protein